ncbi:hypothetical protein ElyMa_002558300 [Elysia marginata]|uniref:TNF family profile domain-containing protein n=1 Tax=Elysia marginata TaxID=1093978 RepID=A0AAV4GYL3_9GAST|nr:hypothetical protein ElyMa_002558300 [Elysia marginata]
MAKQPTPEKQPLLSPPFLAKKDEKLEDLCLDRMCVGFMAFFALTVIALFLSIGMNLSLMTMFLTQESHTASFQKTVINGSDIFAPSVPLACLPCSAIVLPKYSSNVTEDPLIQKFAIMKRDGEQQQCCARTYAQLSDLLKSVLRLVVSTKLTSGPQQTKSSEPPVPLACLPCSSLALTLYEDDVTKDPLMQNLTITGERGREQCCATTHAQLSDLLKSLLRLVASLKTTPVLPSYNTTDLQFSPASAHKLLYPKHFSHSFEVPDFPKNPDPCVFRKENHAYGVEHYRGVNITKTGIVVLYGGLYYVYASVKFRPQTTLACMYFKYRTFIAYVEKASNTKHTKQTILSLIYTCCDTCINPQDSVYAGETDKTRRARSTAAVAIVVNVVFFFLILVGPNDGTARHPQAKKLLCRRHAVQALWPSFSFEREQPRRGKPGRTVAGQLYTGPRAAGAGKRSIHSFIYGEKGIGDKGADIAGLQNTLSKSSLAVGPHKPAKVFNPSQLARPFERRSLRRWSNGVGVCTACARSGRPTRIELSARPRLPKQAPAAQKTFRELMSRSAARREVFIFEGGRSKILLGP